MTALLHWIAAHTSPCDRVAQLQSRAMEGQLSWGQRLDMQLHTFICAVCRRYQAQLHLLRRAVRRYGQVQRCAETDSPGLPASARDRIATVLRQSS